MVRVTAKTVFAPDAYLQIRRGLFDATLGYGGEHWGREVLEPWLDSQQSILAALREAGRAEMATRAMASTDRWALYAFSRLAEVLILPLQPASTDPDQPQGRLPLDPVVVIRSTM